MAPRTLNTAKLRGRLRFLGSVIETAVFEPRLFGRQVQSVLRGRRRYRQQRMIAADWARSAADVRARLQSYLLESGETFDAPSWKGRLAETLVAWNSDEIDHATAGTEIRAITSAIDPDEAVPEAFFAAARATSSSGLFEASHDFVELGYDRVTLDANRATQLWDRLQGVLVEVLRRNIDKAAQGWQPLRDAKPGPGPTRELHAMLDEYLSAIQGTSRRWTRSPLEPVPLEWRRAVEGRRILVDGPGPKEAPRAEPGEVDLVAQVVNFSVLDGETATTPDIVYTNNLTWTTSARRIAARYPDLSWTVVKRDAGGKSDPARGLRGTESSIGRLFLAGHPNMIPIVCFDLVTSGIASAYLIGVNFYASGQRYATGTTEHYQGRLKQTSGMSGHILTENRTFVANLADAGLITGDDAFLATIALDDRAYLRILDDHYGRPRL